MIQASQLVELLFKTEELKLPNRLIRIGYIKQIDVLKPPTLSNLELTPKGEAFLRDEKFTESVAWITSEYRRKFKDLNFLKYGTKAATEKKVLEVIRETNATKEEVLAATDLYIESLDGNYTNNSLASADYFASFTDKQGTKNSKLTQFIEILRESKTQDRGSYWT